MGGHFKIPHPEGFDPAKVKVADWIFTMEVFFKAAGVVVEEQMDQAAAYFKGAAMTWWRTVCEDKSKEPLTWKEAKVELVAEFDMILDEVAARRELDLLTQRDGVISYVATFRAIILRISGMDEGSKVHRFMGGLAPVIRSRFHAQPASLQNAIHQAVFLERYLPVELPQFNTAVVTVAAVTVAAVAPGSCFRCGRAGHFVRNCHLPPPNNSQSRPQKCRQWRSNVNCEWYDQPAGVKNSTGNGGNSRGKLYVPPFRRTSPPSPSTSVTPSSKSHPLALPSSLHSAVENETPLIASFSSPPSAFPSTSNSPLIYLRASLKGRMTDFLIDSGASHCFLREEIAAELGLKSHGSSDIAVVLADGSSQSCRARVATEINLESNTYQVDFFIMPLRFEGILGMSWLEKQNPRIDWRLKSLTLPMVVNTVEDAPEEQILISAMQLKDSLRRGEEVFLLVELNSVEEKVKSHDPEVVSLLKEFEDVFSSDLPNLPPPRKIEHGITLLPGAVPPSQRHH